MINIFEKVKRELEVHNPEKESAKELFPKSPFMNILIERCRQGSVIVNVVDREEWEKIIAVGDILSPVEETDENKKFEKMVITIPSGLQAWEAPFLSVQILEAIGELDPAKKEQKQKDFQKIGEDMFDLALYIEKFSKDTEGKNSLQDFFCHETKKIGQGFLDATGGQAKEKLGIEDIEKVEQELQKVGFTDIYEKIKNWSSEEKITKDEYRQEKVEQFFRIQKKVFENLKTEDYGRFQETRKLAKKIKNISIDLFDVREVLGIYKKKISLSTTEKKDFDKYQKQDFTKKLEYEFTLEEKEKERIFYGEIAETEKGKLLPWKINRQDEQYFEYNHRVLLKKTKTPTRELLQTIGVYGEERLGEALGVDHNLAGKIFIDLKDSQEEIIEKVKSLDIPAKKKELATAKEGLENESLSDSEKKDLLKKIGEIEVRFAEDIQNIVGRMEFCDGEDDAADIWEKQERNCVGSSLVGRTMLETLGIKYTQCGSPSHSFIVIATSDDRLRLVDMVTQYGDYYNKDIFAENIVGSQGESGEETKEKLLKVSRDESHEVVDFDVVSGEVFEKNKHNFARRKRNNTISAYPPETGLLVHNLLWDKSGSLNDKEKAEINKIILSTGSNHEYTIIGMGGALENSGQDNIAEIFYKKAIQIEPDYTGGYFSLAQFYKKRGEYKKAKVCFLKVLELGNAEEDKARVYWSKDFLGLPKK
jgi:tetratricopeptide (TPR) repeat protein